MARPRFHPTNPAARLADVRTWALDWHTADPGSDDRVTALVGLRNRVFTAVHDDGLHPSLVAHAAGMTTSDVDRMLAEAVAARWPTLVP